MPSGRIRCDFYNFLHYFRRFWTIFDHFYPQRPNILKTATEKRFLCQCPILYTISVHFQPNPIKKTGENGQNPSKTASDL